MNTNEIINTTEDNCFHVYNRFNVVFEKGDGVTLYDTDGKAYLDFASGIGVMALGYNNKEFNDAIKAQVDKLYHTSNLYYHPSLAEASKTLCELSGMDKAFFTNSGAEAVEGAIKTAKKYAYNKNYRTPFYPLMDKVSFARFNDFENVKSKVDSDICAIIIIKKIISPRQ